MNEQFENKTIEEAASALIETAEQTQNEDTMYVLNDKKDKKMKRGRRGFFKNTKSKILCFWRLSPLAR